MNNPGVNNSDVNNSDLNNLVLTLTPNPAVDVTYTVDGVELGSSHRVPTPLYRAGGKGLNVSRVAHQLGFPTLAIATVGGLSGERFRADLASSGIPHHLVPVAAATRSSIALVDTAADYCTSIFNESGPALTAQEWQRLAAAVAWLAAKHPPVSASRACWWARVPSRKLRRMISIRHWWLWLTLPGFRPSLTPRVPALWLLPRPEPIYSSPITTSSWKPSLKRTWLVPPANSWTSVPNGCSSVLARKACWPSAPRARVLFCKRNCQHP